MIWRRPVVAKPSHQLGSRCALVLAVAACAGGCTPSTLTARYTISPVLLGPVKTIGGKALPSDSKPGRTITLRASNFRESSSSQSGNVRTTTTTIRRSALTQSDLELLYLTRGNYRRAVVLDHVDCSSYGFFAVTWARAKTLCKTRATVIGEPANAPSCPRALHAAAESGDVAAIRSAAKRGVDIDCRRDGQTALFRAARRGQTAAVRALLAAGANARARGDLGATKPLRGVPTLLVALPHPQVVELLLAGGARWTARWLRSNVRCAFDQRSCWRSDKVVRQQWFNQKLLAPIPAETRALYKKWRLRRPPASLIDDK